MGLPKVTNLRSNAWLDYKDARLVCGNKNDYLKHHPKLGPSPFFPFRGEIFDIPDGPVIHPHDLWAHRDSEPENSSILAAKTTTFKK